MDVEKKKRRSPAKDGLFLRGASLWTRIDGERVPTGFKANDREAAREWRRARLLEAANPSYAAARKTTVGEMINRAIADRKNAPGKFGGPITKDTLKTWESKLGHWGRMLELTKPIYQVDYDAVGRSLEQRHEEGASQHERHKELAALRFALRLEKQRGAYPHDVDYVTRTGRFARGYKPRERHLTWEEIPKLLQAVLERRGGRVPAATLARVKELRAAGVMVKDIALELGVKVPAVCRYMQMDPKPTSDCFKRAQHMAWIIASAGRRKESYRTELVDHDLDNWIVSIRGSKNPAAIRTFPVAYPFRPLMIFALANRPENGPIFGTWTNLNRSLKLACKRAGIAHCSPNDLRRTHSSLLNQGGIALEHIAPIMGHTSTRMLELVYARKTTVSVAKAIAKVEPPPVWLLPPSAGTNEAQFAENTPEKPAETPTPKGS